MSQKMVLTTKVKNHIPLLIRSRVIYKKLIDWFLDFHLRIFFAKSNVPSVIEWVR